ncbi:unnamed protein product [Miscanthus lutarioriparius]|uniref:Dolichyl-diphosphooligosaccharide--protein glycosyltransferase subunit 2 n=1 Tax=Miscanthus lutarioriparius TaxID=422564 RepID=A0A811N291_9POAL|nr:unnamed protein product [Miscanthus lutarioriparius]
MVGQSRMRRRGWAVRCRDGGTGAADHGVGALGPPPPLSSFSPVFFPLLLRQRRARVFLAFSFLSEHVYLLLMVPEETLPEFMSKATRTSVNWVQMVGMKMYDMFQLLPVKIQIGVFLCYHVYALHCFLPLSISVFLRYLYSDDGTFYFDEKHVDNTEYKGPITTSASVIPVEKILGLAKFFLGIGLPGSAKDCFNQIESLSFLENNRIFVPLILSLPSKVFSLTSKDQLKEVALPVLEQLLVEWLLAQPCYLLFRLPPEARGGDEAASWPRLARLRCNLCVFWWPRKRLRAAELPGAVAAGEDHMEPGRRPQRRVQP